MRKACFFIIQNFVFRAKISFKFSCFPKLRIQNVYLRNSRYNGFFFYLPIICFMFARFFMQIGLHVDIKCVNIIWQISNPNCFKNITFQLFIAILQFPANLKWIFAKKICSSVVNSFVISSNMLIPNCCTFILYPNHISLASKLEISLDLVDLWKCKRWGSKGGFLYHFLKHGYK